ncbi:Histone-lysine N-methyltransferase EZ3 [Spatholobus suberectus]|nr:Histone-lysine N-methyltransferase EZ3 [Spatholobus suberectus]
MASKTANSASKHQKQHGEGAKDAARRTLKTKIKQLTDQIHAERGESVKEKVQNHWKNLEGLFSTVKSVISDRASLQTEENVNMLSSRIENPFSKIDGFPEGMVEKDRINNVDLSFAKSIRIPYMEKLPPYTSWVYVARNERMAKDQSVIGKYQMYYDKNGGEMKICSDSEEEIVNPENVKHDFTEAEDRILRITLDEYGSTEEVLSIVKESVKTTDSQIQERYEKLKEKNMGSLDQHSKNCDCRGCESHLGICLEKGLSDTLKTFDTLFCRQCLIFGCPVHGTSQPLIYPSEKPPVWKPEGDRKPCSDQCYLLLKDVSMLSENSARGSFQYKRIKSMEGDSTLPPDESQNSSNELKRISDDIVTEVDNHNRELSLDASDEENRTMYRESSKGLAEHTSKKLTVSGSSGCGARDKGVGDRQKDLPNEIEFSQFSNSTEVQAYEMTSNSVWKPLERDLYLKGVEMFGKNSCLIARNLLPDLKTCTEVARYMIAGGESMPQGSIPSSIMDRNEKINGECTNQEMPSRSRSHRKKGKPRKFNDSRKSAGLPPCWRKIAYGKNLCNKQYTPCGCHGMCGKECPCLVNETCCEKYCGCSKLCNNRFRGCYCIKSQCRSRLCPCFAANRECDPDVCRNCWVSCGDGSLGEPPRRGDGQCGNMNLLLGQKERILLAKSDVTGWGAFAKNPVKKNVCLGEYTGELITHKEAEKCGKLYDCINTSFLFNLNDQASWVIDAYQLGDKLKFVNHSSKPNCYTKVMLVGGDHQVDIFAKENIKAGVELFYDYYYDLDCAPQWAFPPKVEASKKDELVVSQGKDTDVGPGSKQNTRANFANMSNIVFAQDTDVGAGREQNTRVNLAKNKSNIVVAQDIDVGLGSDPNTGAKLANNMFNIVVVQDTDVGAISEQNIGANLANNMSNIVVAQDIDVGAGSEQNTGAYLVINMSNIIVAQDADVGPRSEQSTGANLANNMSKD